jgi:hypothetical protein
MGDQVKSYHPIVFVTGTGRSGTNITKKIFTQHSEIATLPFEHRFTIDPKGVIDFYRSYPQQWSPYWCDHKIKEFIGFMRSLATNAPEKAARTKAAKKIDPTGLVKTHPAYAGWALEEWFPGYSKLVDQLENDLVGFDYRGRWPGSQEGEENNNMHFSPPMTKNDLCSILRPFLDELTGAVLKQNGGRIFLEDNTHSFLYASSLMELYPNAKIIHVVRDPRDVLGSLKAQPWCPNDLDQLIIWYQSVMATWEKEKAMLEEQSWIEFRLEDLIQQKTQTLNSLASFIGVTTTKEMQSFSLDGGNTNRYRSDFNVKDLSKIEAKLGDSLTQYGYSK